MIYKLFLDDIREVKMVYKNLTDDDFVIVRNFHDFKKVIIENGLPELISFDNDLGLDENRIEFFGVVTEPETDNAVAFNHFYNFKTK